MPARDGSGPNGTGPNGRGMGPCRDGQTGWFRGRGFRRGGGAGWGFNRGVWNPADDKSTLDSQKGWLESQLEAINTRLKDIQGPKEK